MLCTAVDTLLIKLLRLTMHQVLQHFRMPFCNIFVYLLAVCGCLSWFTSRDTAVKFRYEVFVHFSFAWTQICNTLDKMNVGVHVPNVCVCADSGPYCTRLIGFVQSHCHSPLLFFFVLVCGMNLIIWSSVILLQSLALDSLWTLYVIFVYLLNWSVKIVEIYAEKLSSISRTKVSYLQDD